MATDIAFAVGALTLLRSRVPAALRVLLLARAGLDDIGAILVIAIFYGGGITADGLLLAGAGCTGVAGLRAAGVRQPLAYVVPGAVLWAGLLRAGVHPTLAGVLLGMMTPVRSWLGTAGAAARVRERADAVPGAADHHEVMGHLAAIGRERREALAPGEYLQHLLHPWVAFGIMPLFALANAGVDLGGASLDGDLWFVFLGVLLGLAVGKPLKVFLAPMLATAKLAILAGSGAAMLVGCVTGALVLPRVSPTAATETEAERSLEH
jgi:NhaA family Na+:H+ antiporter